MTVGKLRRLLEGLPADAKVKFRDLGSDQGVFQEAYYFRYTRFPKEVRLDIRKTEGKT